VERDGKQVNDGWQKIGGEYRWVVTTTSQRSTQIIEVFEGFGMRGEGGGQLLSRDTVTNGVTVHGELKDGKWEVTTPGTNDFQKRTEVFDKVDGTLLSRNTLYGDSYVEEVWGDKGAYTKNVWKTEQHGAEGSKDHIYKLVVANGEMKVTGYHLKGYRVYNGIYEYDTEDGTVTWIYKLKADGTVDKLVYYHAEDFHNAKLGTYSATWRGEGHGRLVREAYWETNVKVGRRYHAEVRYYGWEEWKPWNYSNKIDDFASPSIAKDIPAPEALAAAAKLEVRG
jgi:hypothetical protein